MHFKTVVIMGLTLLLISVTVLGANPDSAAVTAPDDSSKYEVGALRILVHEDVKKENELSTVFINDEAKGVSPVFIEDLKPGTYTVRVEGKTASWNGNVHVEAGKTAGVDVTIREKEASAELYEILLWEDFKDNRNDWTLKPGSLINDGRLVAKTSNSLEYFIARNHSFQDFSVEATFRIKREGSSAPGFGGASTGLPGSVFGFVYRVKGSAVVLLFEASGGRIKEYYLINFEDIAYYSRPIVVGGEMKVNIKDRFRVKTILKFDELQIFIDGQLAGITQVKYTDEGNIGLALGPGLKVEVENLTVGKI